ncbi:hypothetical protein V6Z12_D07G206200 [Gossypium hirsutum]
MLLSKNRDEGPRRMMKLKRRNGEATVMKRKKKRIGRREISYRLTGGCGFHSKVKVGFCLFLRDGRENFKRETFET